MPEASNSGLKFTSPDKNLRGLKAGANLVSNTQPDSFTDEIINDHELAQRKAEEAGSRRCQAAEWLCEMDDGAAEKLHKQPSEEEFRLALRNGLILCNVLNKVNPGAVLKVVLNPVIALQTTEGAAQSAIQYFENMRNFLEAVKNMKLLTFEASDLEKGGSSSKVVDCILCLKGYYEWKQVGGVGVWRYGGTVRITSFPNPKGSSSSSDGSECTDESIDEYESSQYEQLLEFLNLSDQASIKESRISSMLPFLFDHFGLRLLQAYLREGSEFEDLPLNAMVIDALLGKVVNDFSALIVSQGNQLGLFLKKILRSDVGSISKFQFVEAISRYLGRRASQVSKDFAKFCVCGGKPKDIQHKDGIPPEAINIHQKKLDELNSSLQETKLEVKQAQSEWEKELTRLYHYLNGLQMASSSYHKVLEENRILYNQVQDLKGTVRVYCRVRPFLTGQLNMQSTVDYIGENGNIMIMNPLKQGRDSRRVFSFNKVFGTDATQDQIYIDTQPLIRSVLDGFNVCIFAYGQTGSGKTYTMSGPNLMTGESLGVNYRALRDLFQISEARAEMIKYEVGVQMIEIYNEQVRDLLVNAGSSRRLDIRNNSQLSGLNVPDASWVPVTSTQDVVDWMKVGQKNRAVGATALNERSSRSHSILTVHVHGRELHNGTILRGCLHLIDLAGSERVDKSEAVGERLKEAQHINKSLSALGDVIYALAQKSSHIPYRNSKLTQVLQDSLGGQAKTLMFVHINPEVNALGETISTLKFAERVASIELGAARSNKETDEIRELKEEISNLKSALESEETEVDRLKGGNTKTTTEIQKARAASPLQVPRYGVAANSFETRSCSLGKQRRLRFPTGSAEKEIAPNMSFQDEEQTTSSGKPRQPSPPVRRSLSTDRGAIIRISKVKVDKNENQAITKLPFPARVPSIKSTMPSADNNGRVYNYSQEAAKQNNCSDTFFSRHKGSSSKKVYSEYEVEHFEEALNIKQGGIRKLKTESKAKSKQSQLPAASTTLLADNVVDEIEETWNSSDFSQTENDHILAVSPVHQALKVKRLRHKSHNLLSNSHNPEPREAMPRDERILVVAEKLEKKVPNGGVRYPKEGGSTSLKEFTRSRSTPRGKLLVLP